jgi:hypothetical protein
LEELRKQDPKAYITFTEVIHPELEKHGPELDGSYWIRLGGGLDEIRWHARHHGHCRIYCSVESEKRIVALEALTKRWGKFEHRQLCLERLADFRGQDYDPIKREYLHRARMKRKKNGTV